jgi:hypothetical protein
MKLAIMQPYFFPYIGYWQLAQVADRMVIYDDVNYIVGGWVNRNRILINGLARYITVPVSGASPHQHICDLTLARTGRWRDKLLKAIELTYRRAPHFSEVFPLLRDLVDHPVDNLSAYLAHQIQELTRFLQLNTTLISTSRLYANSHLSGQDRVIDICRREGASEYVNLAGGRELYDARQFAQAGVRLEFISMRSLPYWQATDSFVAHLSIVDALMGLGRAGMAPHLQAFDLVTANQE